MVTYFLGETPLYGRLLSRRNLNLFRNSRPSHRSVPLCLLYRCCDYSCDSLFRCPTALASHRVPPLSYWRIRRISELPSWSPVSVNRMEGALDWYRAARFEAEGIADGEFRLVGFVAGGLGCRWFSSVVLELCWMDGWHGRYFVPLSSCFYVKLMMSRS